MVIENVNKTKEIFNSKYSIKFNGSNFDSTFSIVFGQPWPHYSVFVLCEAQFALQCNICFTEGGKRCRPTTWWMTRNTVLWKYKGNSRRAIFEVLYKTFIKEVFWRELLALRYFIERVHTHIRARAHTSARCDWLVSYKDPIVFPPSALTKAVLQNGYIHTLSWHMWYRSEMPLLLHELIANALHLSPSDVSIFLTVIIVVTCM